MALGAAIMMLSAEIDSLASTNAQKRASKINSLAAKLQQLNQNELDAIADKIYALPANLTGHLRSVVAQEKRKLQQKKQEVQTRQASDAAAIEKAYAASNKDVNKTAIGRLFDNTEVGANNAVTDLQARVNAVENPA